jgi:hypothetical protein
MFDATFVTMLADNISPHDPQTKTVQLRAKLCLVERAGASPL